MHIPACLLWRNSSTTAHLFRKRCPGTWSGKARLKGRAHSARHLQRASICNLNHLRSADKLEVLMRAQNHKKSNLFKKTVHSLENLKYKFYNSTTMNNSFLKPRVPISNSLTGPATSNCHLIVISSCLPKLILDQISEIAMCQ